MSSATFLPATKAGRLASRLLAACVSVFAVAIVVALVANDEVDDSSFDIPRLVLSSAFLLTASGAVIAGLFAVIRKRERGVLVFASVAIGLFAVLFALGDMVTQ